MTVPNGAFYRYADVAEFPEDSLDFSKRMLAKTGVARHRSTLDPAHGSHFRSHFMCFSFAGSTADMAEAATRPKAWHIKTRLVR